MPEAIGFPLLGVPENGSLVWPDLADSVRQTLQAILATRPGEQLMRPRFGAGLENFLHEPNTLETRRRLRDTINDALARWEPRILVDRIDVRETPDQPDALRVEIAYRLRRTGAPATLALTLERR